ASQEDAPFPAPVPPSVARLRLAPPGVAARDGEGTALPIAPHLGADREGVAQGVQEPFPRILPVGLADHRVEPAVANVEEVEALIETAAHQGALTLQGALHAVLEDAHRIDELADQIDAVGGGVAEVGARRRGSETGGDRERHAPPRGDDSSGLRAVEDPW